MTDSVKPRDRKTRATRRRIVDAAAELFVADGYGGTTLERIATRAGVAVQTVYFHFGNKRTLLKEAVDVAAVGDDQPVAMLDRDWVDRARKERDPARLIAAWMAYGRDVVTRVGPIMRVVRNAGAVDAEMAEQWATNEKQTASAFLVLAEQLDAMHALRVPVGKAVDILCAVSGLELYLQLAGRGWTPQEWESFVVEFLTHALLADERGSGGSAGR